MGSTKQIKAFTYLPRQDNVRIGTVDKYTFYTSDEGMKREEATKGEFSNISSNPIKQIVTLPHAIYARYFKFSALHVINSKGVAVAELGIKIQ